MSNIETQIKKILLTKTPDQIDSFKEQYLIYNGFFNSNKSMNNQQVKAMFGLHKQYTGVSDYGYYCGACRARIYKELTWINNHLNKEIK